MKKSRVWTLSPHHSPAHLTQKVPTGVPVVHQVREHVGRGGALLYARHGGSLEEDRARVLRHQRDRHGVSGGAVRDVLLGELVRVGSGGHHCPCCALLGSGSLLSSLISSPSHLNTTLKTPTRVHQNLQHNHVVQQLHSTRMPRSWCISSAKSRPRAPLVPVASHAVESAARSAGSGRARLFASSCRSFSAARTSNERTEKRLTHTHKHTHTHDFLCFQSLSFRAFNRLHLCFFSLPLLLPQLQVFTSLVSNTIFVCLEKRKMYVPK